MRPKFFHLLELWRQSWNKHSPSPNENLGILRKQFKYNYYILWGPSFISVVVFSLGYILLRVQLSKNITKCLSFMIIQTYSTHFTINFFIWATWKRKQTIEQQLQHACERTISKQNQVTLHLNWPRVLLFDLQ